MVFGKRKYKEKPKGLPGQRRRTTSVLSLLVALLFIAIWLLMISPPKPPTPKTPTSLPPTKFPSTQQSPLPQSPVPVIISPTRFLPSPSATSVTPEPLLTATMRNGIATRFGRGTINAMAWSHNGKTLAVASGAGIWLYDGQKLDGDPKLVNDPIGPIITLTFSPDDKTLAYVKREVLDTTGTGTLKLLDISTGQIVHTFSHVLTQFTFVQVEANNVAFAPDGQRLAYTTGFNVNLVDVKTEQNVHTFNTPVQETSLGALAFSPDGKILAVAGESEEAETTPSPASLWLWDVSSGKLIGSGLPKGMGSLSMAFSPDSRTLLLGGTDGQVRLWDVASSQVKRTFPARDSVMSVLFSPDGQTIGAADKSGTLELWAVNSGQLVSTIYGLENPFPYRAWLVSNNVLSPNGKSLAYGGDDGSVKVLDVGSSKIVYSLGGYSHSISYIAFSPDSKILASGGVADVQLWNISSGQLIPLGQSQAVNGTVAIANDGKMQSLAISDSTTDRSLTISDTKGGQGGDNLRGYNVLSNGVAASPDGTMIASISETPNRASILLWDVKSRKLLRTLTGQTGVVTAITFSPDSKIVASTSSDQQIRLWDVATGNVLYTLDGTSPWVTSLAFSPDGKYLASGNGDSSVKIWDVNTGQTVKTLGPPSVLEGLSRPNGFWLMVYVAFSPDGKRIAVGSQDNTVTVWDIASAQTVQTFAENNNWVTSIAFSPDGKYLVAGSLDGTLLLWPVQS